MVRAFVLASLGALSFFMALTQPSAAQTVASYSRWGVLGELAERDFHDDKWGGTHIVSAYRWEEPGKRMSLFFSYVGSLREVYTLDEATGDILKTDLATYAKYGNQYASRLKVAADGSIHWAEGGRTYLARGQGNTYQRADIETLVENEPGSPSSEKMQKLIAAGKVRAANPSLRSAIASSNPLTAAPQAPGATPPIGAAVELNATQRAALDRYVKATTGNGNQLQTAHWTDPGKSFVVETISAAGHEHVNYVVRPDGLLALSPEDESKTGYGLIGRVDPESGQITIEWHQGGQLYRSVIEGVAGSPQMILDVTYQGTPTRKNGIQWEEISRVSGYPFSPEQLASQEKLLQDVAKMRADPWGVLSVLPGTLWYCLGDEPDQWLSRRRMYQGQVGYLDESIPQMRFTVAKWREPGRVLEIITKFGDGRGWTDVIELQPDGSFTLNSTGLSQHASLTGKKDQWGQVLFPIANYNYDNRVAENYIQFTAYGPTSPNVSLVVDTNNYPDKSTCTMQAYDAAQLPQLTTELRKMQEYKLDSIQSHINARNEFDADAAAGQQMVANMRAQLVGTILAGGGNGPVAYSPSTSVAGGGQGASFLQELQAMADTAHREAEQSRARTDALIAQATAPTPRQNAGSQPQQQAAATEPSPASPSPASSAAESGAARGPKTFRAYFNTIYVNPPDADHNTFCQSNIFSFTVPAWSSDTDLNDIDAVLEPMKSNFAEKCVAAAGRQLAATPLYELERYGRTLELKPLRAGDHQVTMP